MQYHTESQRSIQSGPSELYRLIASNKYQWDVILQRCTTHPHEACFYDTNAGGHVYALHKLLRHTGNDEDDSNIDIEQQSNTRPPVEVVEAVLLACPRAITRKQALLNEDDLMMQHNNGANNNHMDWQPNNAQVHNLNGGGNQHQGAAEEDNGDNDNEDEQQNEEDAQQNEEEEENLEHDEVRYEYPLAIACECQQDCDVVRLLASYLSESDPAYRSEVFRSLDYASLSSEYVRILLEEYSGCVLERGTNSEVTEGDDDDSPLEQILFWWDDPDMMNMEEDISLYPNCTMQHDLCDLYSKLSMMLYAATTGSMVGYDKSKRTFQVLHYLLHIVSDGGLNGVQFPNDFAHSVLLLAKFIQRARAFQFEERDESGSLPLHIVVSGNKLLKPNIPRIESNEEGDDMVVEGDQDDNENDTHGDNDMGQADDQQQQDNNPIEPQVPPAEQDGEADVDEEDEDEDEDDEMADDEDDNQGEGASMDIDYGLEIVKLLLDQHPSSIRLRDSLSGSLPVHLALLHNPLATEAIEHFLDLYPIAVTMPDGNGRLPIHLALIERSPSWRSILSLSPTKIETRDPITGLLPFQLAAMSKSKPTVSLEKDNIEDVANEADDEGELESLSTCFTLLRMSPCLASGLDNSKQSSQAIMGQQFMMKYKYKPRVTKLEEENERLRQKVEELEAKLQMLQMEGTKAKDTQPNGSPQLKKRKP